MLGTRLTISNSCWPQTQTHPTFSGSLRRTATTCMTARIAPTNAIPTCTAARPLLTYVFKMGINISKRCLWVVVPFRILPPGRCLHQRYSRTTGPCSTFGGTKHHPTPIIRRTFSMAQAQSQPIRLLLLDTTNMLHFTSLRTTGSSRP